MRFHIPVVGLNGMDDLGILLILPRQIHADGHMAALDLMVDGLADVMQQSGPFCGGNVHSEFRCEQPRNMGHLDRVIQHVLAVAGAVFHAAQQLDDLGVEAVDVGLERGALTLRLDGGRNFLLGLHDHFFDPGGVYAPVLYEFFQRESRDLAADGIEAGKGYRLRRIVYNQVAAGKGLDGTNIAAFTSNNTAFHLVVGERYDGYRDFTCVVRGAALNGGCDDLPGSGVGLVLESLFDFPDLGRHIVGSLRI